VVDNFSFVIRGHRIMTTGEVQKTMDLDL
jgi:hypothetical protein